MSKYSLQDGEIMINRIGYFLSSKRNIVNNMRLDSLYLCPGEYVFDKHLKYLIKKDTDSKTRSKIEGILNIKGINNLLKKLVILALKTILFCQSTSILNKGNLQGFTGSVYIPVRSTSGYGDRRIFDIKNNKVLTIFTDRKDYQAVLATYHNFKDYFSMPNILWIDDERQLIIEELILFHPTSFWSEKDHDNVLDTVFERYLEYFRYCEKSQTFTTFSTNDIEFSLIEEEELLFIKEEISKEILDFKIPFVMIHGDLWTSNILLEKSDDYEMKLIDWEYSKELLFFYDFFTLIWLEFYMNNNQYYFKKYINGEYDHFFTEIFSVFELSFKPTYRFEYFHLFFLYFYKERLIKMDKKLRFSILNKYKLLMKGYINQ